MQSLDDDLSMFPKMNMSLESSEEIKNEFFRNPTAEVNLQFNSNPIELTLDDEDSLNSKYLRVSF